MGLLSGWVTPVRDARCAWILMALAVLVGCAAEAPQPVPEPVIINSIIKPGLDPREYRYVELSNGLRAILISDPMADKAAASLQVRAGSGNNPANRPGLAHFLEHMLFLGTESYPEPGEYLEFISAHGGSRNAYTSIDHTNYFFDINPDSLSAALDRFSEFFVSPKLYPDFVDREMNAVESEYRMGIKDDGRREFDVFSEVVNPAHPLAMLAVGNLQTLQGGETDINDDLLAFYEAHYSSNLMTLAVLGRESLDELQTMITERFGRIPNRKLIEKTDAPALLPENMLPGKIYIAPEKDLRELNLLFPAPSARSHYRSKPLEYIGSLLGYEGEGSLLSVLRERGWAEGLGAGSGLDFYGQDAVQVSVQLTEEGVQHQSEITALVFAAIEQLRKDGIERWRFDEQSKLADLAFSTRERGSPTGTVIGAANGLWDYDVRDVLRGPYAFDQYDAELIRAYLDYMRPDNLLVTARYKGVETDQQSQWYEVPYRVAALDARSLIEGAPAPLLARLGLPPANEFVPNTVAVKPVGDEGEVPRRLDRGPGYTLWYLQDAQFAVPKAAIKFQVLSPLANREPVDRALAELYTRLVADTLTDIAYPASQAGVGYRINVSGRGIDVSVSGYDDKQPVLLSKVLSAMMTTDFRQERFDSLKAELLREWSNADKDRPISQLVGDMAPAMAARNWTFKEVRDALAERTLSDLQNWAERFYAETAVDALVHGNHLPAEAKQLGEMVRSALVSRRDGDVAIADVEILRLDAGEAVALERPIDHPDTALLYYLQGPGDSDHDRALTQLTAKILEADFFDQLRTQQQLGYIVQLGFWPMHQVPGLGLFIQSSNTSADGLWSAVATYLDGQTERATLLEDDEFERYRAALIGTLRETPKSQAEKTERLWGGLKQGDHGFNERERLAALLESVTRAEWQAYYAAHFSRAVERGLLLFNQGAANPGAKTLAGVFESVDLTALRAETNRYQYPHVSTRSR